ESTFILPAVQATDASLPTPGLALAFQRRFSQTITAAYRQGLFGRGWTTNWDSRASIDADRNVAVAYGDGMHYFAKQRDGSFHSPTGDTGMLTATTGGYQLVEPTGMVSAFRPDGKLDYVQDAHGNRITAGYNPAGQLNRLTHSNGSYLQLDY